MLVCEEEGNDYGNLGFITCAEICGLLLTFQTQLQKICETLQNFTLLIQV